MIYRKPTFGDIEAIFQLVNDYANDGVMLARSRNTLYETIRDMVVAEDVISKNNKRHLMSFLFGNL